jgi:hypothetical protein
MVFVSWVGILSSFVFLFLSGVWHCLAGSAVGSKAIWTGNTPLRIHLSQMSTASRYFIGDIQPATMILHDGAFGYVEKWDGFMWHEFLY